MNNKANRYYRGRVRAKKALRQRTTRRAPSTLRSLGHKVEQDKTKTIPRHEKHKEDPLKEDKDICDEHNEPQ